MMPAWMAKYPCESCGTGRGACSGLWRANLQCCPTCKHEPLPLDPWTFEELTEMWEGKEKPPHVIAMMERVRPR
jgi:hypothetical protein